MSAAAIPATPAPGEAPAHNQSTRETVESIIVAFILAFLFRAFVAEAFVIPTGSMAPTLMGAHKDIFCQHCGQQYQASASAEFVDGTQVLSPTVTIASTCATCRGLNGYDFRNNRNHATFSGDRILVSKFDYVLHAPERWDVLVFKFPEQAHMNYIKRLVGLPGETLLLQGGDVYVRNEQAPDWQIARKPPSKIRAMRRIVSDTSCQAPVLVEQGWPSLWQPWADGELRGAAAEAWKIEQTAERWQAELSSSQSESWLRYYHKFLDDASWYRVMSGGKLPAVDPYSSSLVTDYLAYNSGTECDRSRLYRNGELRSEIDGQTKAIDLAITQGWPLRGGNYRSNDGQHWVGDLMAEFDVEIRSSSGQLLLDLVEYGIHFRCEIDISTGQARLTASGADVPEDFLGQAGGLTAETSLRGLGSYRIEYANFDDALVLWINGRVVEFNLPAHFDAQRIRPTLAERRPHWTAADPLDAAPLGIGGKGLDMSVERAQVYRDIYYIAIRGNVYSDYDLQDFGALLTAAPQTAARNQYRSSEDIIADVYAHPQWWEQTNLFSQRSTLKFELAADQYFPMGDNSAASSDARAWSIHHVDQQFLLGKALLVFWPHTWNRPIPFTPNFPRMGLIR